MDSTNLPQHLFASADTRIWRLSGEINGPMQNNVQKLLTYMRASGEHGVSVILLIDSPGGAISLADGIYQSLSCASKEGIIRLNTYNEKITESSAVCVFCAGIERWSAQHGRFMVHKARFRIFEDDTPEMKARAEPEETVKTKRMAEIIAQAISRSEDDVAALLAQARVMDVREAQMLGLVHHVGTFEMAAGIDVVELREGWLE